MQEEDDTKGSRETRCVCMCVCYFFHCMSSDAVYVNSDSWTPGLKLLLVYGASYMSNLTESKAAPAAFLFHFL